MKNRALFDMRNDVQEVVREAQEYFRQAAEETGDRASQLINRGVTLLDSTVDSTDRVRRNIARRGEVAVRSADDYVTENTWRSMAIAAGVGLLFGYAMTR